LGSNQSAIQQIRSRLLFHELVHARQQGFAHPSSPESLRIGDASDRSEVEAETLTALPLGTPLQPTRSEPVIARKGKPPAASSGSSTGLEQGLGSRIGGFFFASDRAFVENAATGILFDSMKADFYLVLKPEFKGTPKGTLIPRPDVYLTADPLAGGEVQDATVRATRDEVRNQAVSYPPTVGPYLGYYRGPSGTIWPNIFSARNTPGIVAACQALDDKFRKEMLATAEAFRHVLWWYVGLRFAPGIKMGSAPEELVAAGTEGAAVSAAFNAVKVADELVSATEAIANPGAKLVQAARSLSQMTEVAAPQKVEVILEFIKRIGFAISKEGVVDEGAAFLMKAENGRAAFRFIKATAKILYGKFDMTKMDYIWTEL
jgi:hypothetical protein